VAQILSKLPADLWAGVLIVQHMPPTFTPGFARHLDGISPLNVKEASEGDILSPGLAYVAPGDYHVLVDRAGVLHLDKSARRHGVRPCINMSMVSASNAFGKKVLGVVLSGMGDDGAFGLKVIKRKGGRTIAQDRETSVVFGMAKAASDLGAVDMMIPADMIAESIVKVLDDMKMSLDYAKQPVELEATREHVQ
jgi:two-component system chemotaxis response regulator CheB